MRHESLRVFHTFILGLSTLVPLECFLENSKELEGFCAKAVGLLDLLLFNLL